jgi:hypothetical protein
MEMNDKSQSKEREYVEEGDFFCCFRRIYYIY